MSATKRSRSPAKHAETAKRQRADLNGTRRAGLNWMGHAEYLAALTSIVGRATGHARPIVQLTLDYADMPQHGFTIQEPIVAGVLVSHDRLATTYVWPPSMEDMSPDPDWTEGVSLLSSGMLTGRHRFVISFENTDIGCLLWVSVTFDAAAYQNSGLLGYIGQQGFDGKCSGLGAFVTGDEVFSSDEPRSVLKVPGLFADSRVDVEVDADNRVARFRSEDGFVSQGLAIPMTPPTVRLNDNNTVTYFGARACSHDLSVGKDGHPNPIYVKIVALARSYCTHETTVRLLSQQHRV